uniref:uncharacterized protein LOC114584084 n=1 Tax=Podarcis muralis TaxID=64176 RepID=UPI0010A033E7
PGRRLGPSPLISPPAPLPSQLRPLPAGRPPLTCNFGASRLARKLGCGAEEDAERRPAEMRGGGSYGAARQTDPPGPIAARHFSLRPILGFRRRRRRRGWAVSGVHLHANVQTSTWGADPVHAAARRGGEQRRKANVLSPPANIVGFECSLWKSTVAFLASGRKPSRFLPVGARSVARRIAMVLRPPLSEGWYLPNRCKPIL